MLYVCAQSRRRPATRVAGRFPRTKQGKVADLGSVFTITGFGPQPGTSRRSTPRRARSSGRSSGRSRATRARPRPPASSSSSAATNGELQAYDAETGDQLWSFQTGAGANTTRDDLRARRQAVRRLLRGRQLARRRRRTATTSGCSRSTASSARRRPAGAGEAPGTPARRPPAPSDEAGDATAGADGLLATTARAATAPTARRQRRPRPARSLTRRAAP